MNKERPDEREAKEIVVKSLGVELDHADKHGGVDYRSPDGRHALEVTRVTTGERRAGRVALDASRAKGTPQGALQTCWLTMAPDTQQGLRTFLQQVHPALVGLELAGETVFERQRAALHVIQGGPLSSIYQQLLDAGVERASAMPDHGHSRRTHQVMTMLGNGGTASDSDQAVGRLTGELSKMKDNPKKLKASGAVHRHLFVWLDGDTRFDIARPLSRPAPSWRDGFGLPSKPPALDHATVGGAPRIRNGLALGWSDVARTVWCVTVLVVKCLQSSKVSSLRTRRGGSGRAVTTAKRA